MDEIDTRLIKQCFNGSPEHYKQALAKSCEETIHWFDLNAACNVYPDLEEAANILIKERLGYLPPKQITLPYEPFLRTLIYAYHNKQIDFDNLWGEACDYIELIKKKVFPVSMFHI